MSDWVPGHVVEQRQWSDELRSLILDAPVKPFDAGQFTRLGLEIDGKRIARPYSYVNAPHERPLEFFYSTAPEGHLTRSMSALRPGASIWVDRRPGGTLTLENLPDAETLWMLATGTAIGPFLSILKTPAPWKRFGRIVLAHSVRHIRDAGYRQATDGIGQTHRKQFVMVPFVTRQRSSGALAMRIPEAIRKGILERAAGAELKKENAQVMICGNSDMVRDTTAILEEQGLRRNRRAEPGQISAESYF